MLEPLLKPRVWGGRRLRTLGRGSAGPDPIGESWEVADLPSDVDGGRSTIVRGPGRGGTLRSLIERDRRAVLGVARPADDGGFPLLVKLLDAGRDLSIQVHPTPAYHAINPAARLKTESWVIMDADPGSRLLLGFRPEHHPRPAADALRAAALDGGIVDMLASVPARVGACHTLPTGLCHALGGGILALEVQTPSDTTFRLYDWGRPDRTLHLDEAVTCLCGPDAPLAAESVSPDRDDSGRAEPAPSPNAASPGGADPGDASAVPGPAPHLDSTRLARTAAYRLDLLRPSSDADGPTTMNPTVSQRPSVLTVTAGTGQFEDAEGVIELVAGTTVVLPAALTEGVIRGADDLRIVRAVPEATED